MIHMHAIAIKVSWPLALSAHFDHSYNCGPNSALLFRAATVQTRTSSTGFNMIDKANKKMVHCFGTTDNKNNTINS